MRSINTFEGIVDKDSTHTVVKNNNLIDALNTYSGKGGQLGSRHPMPGNTAIAFTLPSGINTVIGCGEDAVGNSLVYLVKNSLNEHLILRYFPVEEEIREVMRGSFLGFNNRIHSARIIDGDLLVWCDGWGRRSADEGYQFTGTEPKMISLSKANLDNKLLTYEFYYDAESFQTLDQTYSISVLDFDDNVIYPSTVFYTVNPVIDADTAFAAFTAALSALGAPITVTAYGNTTVVSPTLPGRKVAFTQSTTDLHLTSVNHYPLSGMLTSFITLKKAMPLTAPVPRQVADSNLKENKIWGNTFQFRYRYIYFDGSRSEFSPISYAPTNFIRKTTSEAPQEYYNSKAYNKIVVDFNDTKFGTDQWKSIIRKVELAVRVGEDGIWKSVEVYNIADVGVNVNEVDFLNDSVYSVVPSDANSEADTQALKNFDYVPRLAETLVPVYGNEGECRLAIGGMIDDYDLEPALYADLAIFGYDLPDFDDPDDQYSFNKTFKAGGVYDVYVEYEDDYGRQSPALKLGRIRFPFAAPFDAYGFTVDFNTKPPIWADRFRILVSKNQNQSRYLQFPCSAVRSFHINKERTDIQVGFAVGADTTHLGFFVSPVFFDKEEFFSGPKWWNASEDNILDVFLFESDDVTHNVFLPDNNDRIQILNVNGFPLGSAEIENLNFPVAGYSYVNLPGDSLVEGFYVFIEVNDDFLEVAGDMVNWGFVEYDDTVKQVVQCELYRPKTQNDVFSYELDFMYFVANQGLPNRSHGAQKVIDDRGDTYISDFHIENVITLNGFSHIPPLGSDPLAIESDVVMLRKERPNLHTSNEQAGGDLGRANAPNEFYREVYSYDKIRLSDVYLPDVAINGLSAFRGGEFIKVNKDLGYIKRMELLGDVVLVVCQIGCQPIYVGSVNVIDLGGGSLMGISDKILNIGKSLITNFGSFHPESIVNNGRYVYGFDVRQGVVWRYNTGNGLFAVSDYFWHNHFKDMIDENWTSFERGSFDAEGGYDPLRNIYFIFTTDPLRNKQTIGFSEDKNGFEGHYSFDPKCFGRVGIDMITFKDGVLWRHANTQAVDVDFCNYYGDQFDCTATFVLNEMPVAVKIPKNIKIRSDKSWHVSNVQVLPNGSFAEGQQSRIRENRFRLYEGQWCAEFLRDMNDTKAEYLAIGDPVVREKTALLQGRLLRGEAILITLKLDDPSKNAKLESVETEFIISENSK